MPITLQMIGRILMLRSGPQDLPFSNNLLIASIAASIVVNLLSLSVSGAAYTAIPQTVVVTLLAAAYVVGLLQIRDRRARTAQTLTALFSTQAALGVLALAPLRALMPVFQTLAENPDAAASLQAPGGAMLAYVAISIWSVVVTAHVFRHALDVQFIVGVGLALLQGMLIWIVMLPFAA